MHNLGHSLAMNIEAEYDVVKLIDALVTNKATHIDDYNKAVEVYHRDLELALARIVKAVKKQLKDHTDKDEVTNSYQSYVRLKTPVNAEKNYDMFIDLFSKTSSDKITLSLNDANSIINDEWDWAQEAKLSNSTYSSRY